MNAVIKNYQRLMKSTSSRDPGTLGFFASHILISQFVSNKAAFIKKMGNYEMHRQFLVLIGREFLGDGLKSFFTPHIPQLKEEHAKNKEQAKETLSEIMLDFLKEHKIPLWFNPTEQSSVQYFDDLQKYSSDLAARSLLLMIFSHAIKYGDPICIRACQRQEITESFYFIIKTYVFLT